MKTKKRIPYILLGPIITLALMLLIYALAGIYPFGRLTTAIGDGMAQYVPFLTELAEKIKNGGSLFFTWHAGRGTDFWSIIAYYLASPFNLIALFFGENEIIDYRIKLTINDVSTVRYYIYRIDGAKNLILRDLLIGEN